MAGTYVTYGDLAGIGQVRSRFRRRAGARRGLSGLGEQVSWLRVRCADGTVIEGWWDEIYDKAQAEHGGVADVLSEEMRERQTFGEKAAAWWEKIGGSQLITSFAEGEAAKAKAEAEAAAASAGLVPTAPMPAAPADNKKLVNIAIITGVLGLGGFILYKFITGGGKKRRR